MPGLTQGDFVEEDTDIFLPCERLWKFEGAVVDTDKDDCTRTCRELPSFKDLPDSEQTRQLQFKKILGILNKMTPKMFHKLILQIGPETVDLAYIKMLAEIIFSKALDDEIYVNLYAKLCDEMMSKFPIVSLEHFRNTLSGLCQTGFDNLLNLTDDDIMSINEDKRYVFKRRLMTLMRFIGEMSCSKEPLFDRQNDWMFAENLINKGDELHLEALYYLLFTCSLRNENIPWTATIKKEVDGLSKGFCRKGAVSLKIRIHFVDLQEFLDHTNRYFIYDRLLRLEDYVNEYGVEEITEGVTQEENVDYLDDARILICIFPDSINESTERILSNLKLNSTGLNTDSWRIVRRFDIDGSVQLTLAVDEKSSDILEKSNFEIKYKGFTVRLKQLGTSWEEEMLLSRMPFSNESSERNQILDRLNRLGNDSEETETDSETFSDSELSGVDYNVSSIDAQNHEAIEKYLKTMGLKPVADTMRVDSNSSNESVSGSERVSSDAVTANVGSAIDRSDAAIEPQIKHHHVNGSKLSSARSTDGERSDTPNSFSTMDNNSKRSDLNAAGRSSTGSGSVGEAGSRLSSESSQKLLRSGDGPSVSAPGKISFGGAFRNVAGLKNDHVLATIKNADTSTWVIKKRKDLSKKKTEIIFEAELKSLVHLKHSDFTVEFCSKKVRLSPIGCTWDFLLGGDGRGSTSGKSDTDGPSSVGTAVGIPDQILEIAVFHEEYPDRILEMTTVNFIVEYLEKASIANSLKFDGVLLLDGWMLLLCKDVLTFDWSRDKMDLGKGVFIKSGIEIPRVTVKGCLPINDWKGSPSALLSKISVENRSLEFSNWKVVSSIDAPHGCLVRFSLDANSFHALYNAKNRIYCGGILVNFDCQHSKVLMKESHNHIPVASGKRDENITVSGFKYKTDDKLYKKAEKYFSKYVPSKAPEKIIFIGKFSGCNNYKTKSILQTLISCNPHCDVAGWSAVSRMDVQGQQLLTFSADRESLKGLAAANFKLFFNSDSVCFETVSGKPWQVELSTENSSSSSRVLGPTECSSAKTRSTSSGATSSKPPTAPVKVTGVSVATSSKPPTAPVKVTGVSGATSSKPTTAPPNVTGISGITSSKNKISTPVADDFVTFWADFPVNSQKTWKNIRSLLVKENPGFPFDSWVATDRVNWSKLSFCRFFFKADVAPFKLNNKYTVVYDGRTIPLHLPNGRSLATVLNESASGDKAVAIKPVKKNGSYYLAIFPDTIHMKNVDILKRIERCNQISIKKLKIIDRSNCDTSSRLTFFIDSDYMAALRKIDFTLCFGTEFVKLEPIHSSNSVDAGKANNPPAILDNKVGKVSSTGNLQSNTKSAPVKRYTQVVFQLTVPDSCDMKKKQLINCLMECNRHFDIGSWVVVTRVNSKKGSNLTFEANPSCLNVFKSYGYRINFQTRSLSLVPLYMSSWKEWEQYFNDVPSQKNIPVKTTVTIENAESQPSTRAKAIPDSEPTAKRPVKMLEDKPDRTPYTKLRGYKVAVLPEDFPKTLLSDQQLSAIEHDISARLKRCNDLTSDFPLKLRDYCRFSGWLLVLCQDAQTWSWLINLKLVPWPGARLKCV